MLHLPEDNAIASVVAAPLGKRPEKPRKTGLTMVIDKGLGVCAMQDLLEPAGQYIDYFKFGFGTSLLYPAHLLQQKIALATLYSVCPCTGGTLAEIAIHQHSFEAFLEVCQEYGFGAVEVSDGTLQLSQDQRAYAIRTGAKRFTVVSEVGKKLEAFPQAETVVEQILRDLDAGSRLVIIEGRENGENAGIYGDTGLVKEEVFNRLLQLLPVQALASVMWEAPKKAQQVAMLKRFGKHANLGNIAPSDVIALESLRRGLRADTFAWTLE